MKTISNYIGMVLALLSAAFFAGGCGDDYEYSTDYSAYDGATLKIDLADQNDVLNLNLINGTYVLKVNVTPEDIVIPPEGYLYTIEDETVATVKKDGTLTMLKAGETKLTVKFRGNKEVSASCTVKISPILTSELRVPASIMVQEEKTLNLLPQITTVPSQASKKFTYRVADETIATVSEEGVVTGVSAGSTVITVTTTDGTDIAEDIPVEVVGKIYISDIKLPADKVNGKTFVAGQVLPIGQYMEILPVNASEKIVKFSLKESGEGVADVTEEGVVTCKSAGTATILVEAQDGSEVQNEIEITVVASGWYERSFWFVDTSYRFDSPKDDLGEINYIPDNTKGKPEQLIDGKSDTYLTYLKPNRGDYNGYQQLGTEHYLTVDMGGAVEFNCFKWRHRNTSNKNWQVWKVSIYGSNDGGTYTLIQENISLDKDAAEKDYDIPASKYRYIKVEFLDWDKNSGSNMCIAEFNVCKK